MGIVSRRNGARVDPTEERSRGAQVVCLAQARAERLLRGRRAPAGRRLAGLRALVLDGRGPGPAPEEDAVLMHARGLRALGYAVSVLDLSMGGTRRPAAEVGAWFGTADAGTLGTVLHHAQPFDLVVLHGAGAGAAPFAAIRRGMPAARLVFSPHEADAPAAAQALGAAADVVLARSAPEAEALRGMQGCARVRVVPRAVTLRRAGSMPRFDQRAGVAMLVGPDPAQAAAAQWLVAVVMPLVWRADPGIGCLLAGDGLPDAVRALAGPRVTVVPGSEALDRARLTVAPAWGGPEQARPVLLSLGARVPCVMAPAAAAALTLTPALRACVAGEAAGPPDPEATARAILWLHGNKAAWSGVARAGAALLRQYHSEAAMMTALSAACAWFGDARDAEPSRRA